MTMSESDGPTISGNTVTENITGLWFSGFWEPTGFSLQLLMLKNSKAINTFVCFILFSPQKILHAIAYHIMYILFAIVSIISPKSVYCTIVLM